MERVKHISFLTTLFLVLVWGCIAEAQIKGEWTTVIEDDSTRYLPVKAMKLDKQNYLLVGEAIRKNSRNKQSWSKRPFLAKMKTGGVILWKREIDIYSQSQKIHDAVLTNQNEVVMAGEKNMEGWFLKVDLEGKILASRSYDREGHDLFKSISQTKAGFLVTGSQNYSTSDSTNSQIWVAVLDSGGTIQWERTYGEKEADNGKDAVVIADNYFISGTVTHTDSTTRRSVTLLKTDNSGTLRSQKTYENKQRIYSISETMKSVSDGGFILSGQTSLGFDASYGYLLRLDSDGNLEWENIRLPTDACGFCTTYKLNDVAEMNNQESFVTVGTSYFRAYIAHLSKQGEVLQEKYFGNPSTHQHYAFNGIIKMGSSNQFLVYGFLRNDSLMGATVLKKIQINIGSQVIENPGFEQDGKSTMKGWNMLCTTQAIQPAFQEEAPGSGEKWSIKVPMANVQGACIEQYVYQLIPEIQNGEIWTFSAGIKRLNGPDDSPGGLHFIKLNKNDSSKTILRPQASSDSFEWDRISVTDTLLFNDNEVIGVALNPGTVGGPNYGETLFDQVSLSREGRVTAINSANNQMPKKVRILGNYPNPFNPTTRIQFELSYSGFVRLAIYNALGQELRVLAARYMKPGVHDIIFKAGGLPSGLYIYRLKMGSQSESGKMLLLK